jgi:hypothetical protein
MKMTNTILYMACQEFLGSKIQTKPRLPKAQAGISTYWIDSDKRHKMQIDPGESIRRRAAENIPIDTASEIEQINLDGRSIDRSGGG